MTSALAAPLDRMKTTKLASIKALFKAAVVKVRAILIMVIRKTTALLVQTQIASAINKLSMIMLETTAALIKTRKDEYPSITKTRINRFV